MDNKQIFGEIAGQMLDQDIFRLPGDGIPEFPSAAHFFRYLVNIVYTGVQPITIRDFQFRVLSGETDAEFRAALKAMADKEFPRQFECEDEDNCLGTLACADFHTNQALTTYIDMLPGKQVNLQQKETPYRQMLERIGQVAEAVVPGFVSQFTAEKLAIEAAEESGPPTKEMIEAAEKDTDVQLYMGSLYFLQNYVQKYPIHLLRMKNIIRLRLKNGEIIDWMR